eukprot:TRINITY_DN59364_c0_g1_i1.p1 TRINITY_DN59364_c0_g1~~TRINITY_DN59364_c0_g1_i1.p1  ORF type:complete len:685 (+),score=80.69 TRINITY_DN59364_c0_g1_i1:2-2056(+)
MGSPRGGCGPPPGCGTYATPLSPQATNMCGPPPQQRPCSPPCPPQQQNCCSPASGGRVTPPGRRTPPMSSPSRRSPSPMGSPTRGRSEMGYKAMPSIASFDSLMKQHGQAAKLKSEGEAVRQVRELEYLQTQRELEIRKKDSLSNATRMERDLRDQQDQLQRIRESAHRTQSSMQLLEYEREQERLDEEVKQRQIAEAVAEIEKEKDKARLAELLNLRKMMSMQTERRAELALEKLQLDSELHMTTSMAKESALSLEMKQREIEDRERGLELEWIEIERRKRAINTSLQEENMHRGRPGVVSPMNSMHRQHPVEQQTTFNTGPSVSVSVPTSMLDETGAIVASITKHDSDSDHDRRRRREMNSSPSRHRSSRNRDRDDELDRLRRAAVDKERQLDYYKAQTNDLKKDLEAELMRMRDHNEELQRATAALTQREFEAIAEKERQYEQQRADHRRKQEQLELQRANLLAERAIRDAEKEKLAKEMLDWEREKMESQADKALTSKTTLSPLSPLRDSTNTNTRMPSGAANAQTQAHANQAVQQAIAALGMSQPQQHSTDALLQALATQTALSQANSQKVQAVQAAQLAQAAAAAASAQSPTTPLSPDRAATLYLNVAKQAAAQAHTAAQTVTNLLQQQHALSPRPTGQPMDLLTSLAVLQRAASPPPVGSPKADGLASFLGGYAPLY